MVHKKRILDEVLEVIAEVDANACKTEVYKEQRARGRSFYSPRDLSKAFWSGFERAGWKDQHKLYQDTVDENILRDNYILSHSEQKETIGVAGDIQFMSDNKTDLVKDRVAAEIQFGKYEFVAHSQFVKHLGLYVFDHIDVGIEILPMKALEQKMSSGLPYYERNLLKVVRQGRGVPRVPLVLIGVAP